MRSGSGSPTRPPFAQSETWYPNPQPPVYHSGPVYSNHPGKFSVFKSISLISKSLSTI